VKAIHLALRAVGLDLGANVSFLCSHGFLSAQKSIVSHNSTLKGERSADRLLLTTEKFEERMVGKISTLTTDKTFSCVVTKPLS
jgi:hypothetical protein